MKRRLPFPIRLGILGGGQLARMLALKAHELGLDVRILSASPLDPAGQVVRHHHAGDVNSEKDLRAFLASVDMATFESEFLDPGLLKRLSDELKIPVHPDPAVMGRLQDRLEQKEALLTNRLATAPFCEVNTVADAETALVKLGGRMVLKKRRFGYDGYGTFVVRSADDLHKLRSTIESDAHGFIAEAFVGFKRELAIMCARRPSGETLCLPLVESFQQNSRCLWVKGPVKTDGSAPLVCKLRKFMAALDYSGILGIELFATGQSLLINELAPRVHNSAHYSLDALEEDQFTLHLKAILDMPFSRVKTLAPGFAMYNLLGEHSRHPSWDLPKDVHLHWYGKSENRPGRKMGHINALGTSPAAALKRLLKIRASFDV